MRVFDFDGTIYDGESLFDLYLYSARHDPKVFRFIAPVLRYAVKYKLEPNDVILTASFDLTVGEACRRLGVRNLVASNVDMETMKVTYLNFNTNKARRFRELYGPDAVVDEFYTDSRFDQPMIDMARRAFMVKGNTITRVK